MKGPNSEKADFFKLFSVEAGEPDLWNQRNLLFKDVRTFLVEGGSDAPLQLKEFVTRKATTEHASTPIIRRVDVLRALETNEADLWPAQCLIAGPTDGPLPREQEGEIRAILEAVVGAPINLISTCSPPWRFFMSARANARGFKQSAASRKG